MCTYKRTVQWLSVVQPQRTQRATCEGTRTRCNPINLFHAHLRHAGSIDQSHNSRRVDEGLCGGVIVKVVRHRQLQDNNMNVYRQSGLAWAMLFDCSALRMRCRLLLICQLGSACQLRLAALLANAIHVPSTTLHISSVTHQGRLVGDRVLLPGAVPAEG